MADRSFLTWICQPKRDGLWIALAILGLYELLRQPMLYGDAIHMLPEAYAGKIEHGQHLLYLPTVRALRDTVGEWFGLSIFTVMSHLSCVATALGLWFAHKAFRALDLQRSRAALATALCGLCPGVVFFASLIEIHALFFAAAGLAFWAMAVLAKRPGPWRALVFGLATGLAYLTHASGALMPLPLGLAAFAAGSTGLRPTDGTDRRASFRSWIPLWSMAALGHLAMMALPYGLRALKIEGFVQSIDQVTDYYRVYADGVTSADELGALVGTFLNEWVFALMPLSVAFIVAFEFRRLRRLAACTVLSTAPYLFATFMMLVGLNEHGAYFFVFPFLLAWLTVESLPRVACLLLLVLAGSFAYHDVRSYEDPLRYRRDARAIEDLYPEQPLAFVVAGQEDVELWAIERPDDPALYVTLFLFGGEEAFRGLLPNLDAILAGWFADGRIALVSPELLKLAQPGTLGNGGSDVLREVLLPHLRAHYDVTERDPSRYGGLEVRPKR